MMTLVSKCARQRIITRCALLILAGAMSISISAKASTFPAAGWHRGDVAAAQENSRQAILAAFNSPSPNIEVDVIDFTNEKGERVGLLAHDYSMKRITGSPGKFIDHHQLHQLPPNRADVNLPAADFMTVVELFNLIQETKKMGRTPFVSLDMKEEGESGREFGQWLGALINRYQFQDHVFASSFFKSNIDGVKETCSACMVGGLVFKDHYALKHLDTHYSSLDLTPLSKLTYFFGFLGKKKYPHDFVLIQDDVIFKQPGLLSYWKDQRNVKFVGVFVYKKQRGYTKEEWQILKQADWLELDPPQMSQFINH